MNPTAFFDIWCKVTGNHYDKLLNWQEYWYNSSGKTELMKTIIYPEIAEELSDGYNYYCEYYGTDVVFYTPDDKITHEVVPVHEVTLRKIGVALEHENRFDYNLRAELCHHLILDASLKVIVTYPNWDDPTTMLEFLSNIVSEMEISKDFRLPGQLLLIFGIRVKDDIYWRGYVYESPAFVQLPGTDRLIGTFSK